MTNQEQNANVTENVQVEETEIIQSEKSTNDDTSSDTIQEHLHVVTTPVPPSHSERPEEPVHYVDERTKAMGRKAELEELRKKNDVSSKKAAFNKASPMSTSTLASFFLKQKQMKNEVREKRLGALHSLNQFRFQNFGGFTPKSMQHQSNNQFNNMPSAYSTMPDIDDFFRKQRQIDLEWKENKEKAFARLHLYRQEHVHKNIVNKDSEEPLTSDSEICGGRNDTAVLNVLLMVHAELRQFFDVPGGIDDDQVVSRLSFEHLNLNDSSLEHSKTSLLSKSEGLNGNDDIDTPQKDDRFPGYFFEEKKEQDLAVVERITEPVNNSAETNAAEEASDEGNHCNDSIGETWLSEGIASVSDHSQESGKTITEVLDELLEDDYQLFEFTSPKSENQTDANLLENEAVDAESIKQSDDKKTATEDDEAVGEVQNMSSIPSNDCPANCVENAKVTAAITGDDVSPVLDPISSSVQELSTESTPREEEQNQLDMMSNLKVPRRISEEDGTQQVQITEQVLGTPPPARNTSRATIADSSVSSIGSSSPLLFESSGGKLMRDTSMSSGTTFWRNDLPPPPDRPDNYAALAVCGTEQYLPNLHGSRGACERCLYLASDDEKRLFKETGRHIRIMIVRGGCRRDCAVYPRQEDEPPVRLCRKCYFDTHRKAQKQNSSPFRD